MDSALGFGFTLSSHCTVIWIWWPLGRGMERSTVYGTMYVQFKVHGLGWLMDGKQSVLLEQFGDNFNIVNDLPMHKFVHEPLISHIGNFLAVYGAF